MSQQGRISTTLKRDRLAAPQLPSRQPVESAYEHLTMLRIAPEADYGKEAGGELRRQLGGMQPVGKTLVCRDRGTSKLLNRISSAFDLFPEKIIEGDRAPRGRPNVALRLRRRSLRRVDRVRADPGPT